eukprot:s4374_g3.t1
MLGIPVSFAYLYCRLTSKLTLIFGVSYIAAYRANGDGQVETRLVSKPIYGQLLRASPQWKTTTKFCRAGQCMQIDQLYQCNPYFRAAYHKLTTHKWFVWMIWYQIQSIPRYTKLWG